jgi:hypothetical protein
MRKQIWKQPAGAATGINKSIYELIKKRLLDLDHTTILIKWYICSII